MSSPTTSPTSTPSGYKADRSLFEEYLTLERARGQFRRQRPPAVLRAGPRHLPRFLGKARPKQTKNPLDVAIDGDGFLAVQTPAGERYTRDGGLQINNQGQLVTAVRLPVLGNPGPIVFQPTDKQINIAADGNVTVLEGTGRIDSVRGKLRMVSFAAGAAAGEGRLQPLLGSAKAGRAARHQVAIAPGLHREVQRQLGASR